MKKSITLLLLTCTFFVKAQVTSILMPVGYGTDGTNRASLPLFQFGDMLYVKTAIIQPGNNLEGKIFKVNMNTNEITLLTSVAANPNYTEFYSLWWDYGMSQVRNVKEINGEIYFNGWQTSIYKINPSDNTVSHLTNVQYDFEVSGNCLIPIGGNNGGLEITNLNYLQQYFTPNVIIDNNTYFIRLTQSFVVNNNLYAIGYYEGSGILSGTQKLYRINNSTYPNLGLTDLYTFNSNVGSLIGFYEVGYNGKPFVLNNTIIWKRTYWDNDSSQYFTTLASYNLSNNNFNDSLFVPEGINDFQYFVFNNNLYIKNSQNQFYVTNGWSTPVLSTMPNFYQYGSNFAFSFENPYTGYGSKPIVEYNGNMFGKDLGLDSNYPKKIWKTDGISNQLISDGLDLYSAKVHNSNLYAYGFYTATTNYYYSSIMKFNTANNTFESIWSFPNGGYGIFSSHLFFHNNSVFFTGQNIDSMPYSLHKIDLSTLSTQSFTSQKIIFSPNPTASTITFSQEIFGLEVFNVSGKKVKTFQNSNTTFNVESLKKGIYFLKGKTSEQHIFTEKLVKQ